MKQNHPLEQWWAVLLNYYMEVLVEQGDILTSNHVWHKKKRKIRVFEYLVIHDFCAGGKVSDAFIRICLIRKNAPDLPGWVNHTDLFWFILQWNHTINCINLIQLRFSCLPWWVLINCYVSVDQVCGKHASRHDGCLKVLWQNSSQKITILFHKIFSKKASPKLVTH